MEKKEREFLHLEQGTKSVREYTIQFDRLSRFGRHLISTPQQKIRKFHRGLDPNLRNLNRGHLDQSFESLVRLAIGLEDDGCCTSKAPPAKFPPRNRLPSQANQGVKRTWNGEKKSPTAPSQTNATNRVPNDNKCFNCDSPGHHTHDCPKPKMKSQANVVCYNCGKLGHIKRNCTEPRIGANAQRIAGRTGLNAIIPEETGFYEEE